MAQEDVLNYERWMCTDVIYMNKIILVLKVYERLITLILTGALKIKQTIDNLPFLSKHPLLLHKTKISLNFVFFP